MKTIRLLPNQVPTFWEQIKYAAAKADRIPENELSKYLIRLLTALLNDQAQCFIRFNEDRELFCVMITRISVDEVTGDKILFINCIYSFRSVSEEQWKDDMEIIKKFARNIGCERIVTYSTVQRIFDIAISVGFRERYRCFALDL